MRVYVHIWEDNANVYATQEAALEGIAVNHDEHEAADVQRALDYAEAHPGDAAYIDDGMSTVRCLGVSE